MNYNKILITCLMILTANCGSLKVDTDIDDAVDKLTERAGEIVDGVTDDLDNIDDVIDGDSEENQNSEYFLVGSFRKLINTCDDLTTDKNVRFYSNEITVQLRSTKEELLASGDLFEDETFDFGFKSNTQLTSNGDYECRCELDDNNEIRCDCESNIEDCTIIYEETGIQQ